MLVQHFLEHRRITIACDDNHRVFRTIPALMEKLQHPGGGGCQRFSGPYRRAICKPLSGKEQFPGGVLDYRLRAGALAQFGQYHRSLGINRRNTEARGTDHTRQYLQAFVEAGRTRIGQIKLVDGLRRRGFGVAVAAECRAQALPDPFCLPVGDMSRAAKRQMLHEMGKSLFFLGLHQRADIDPQADRNLSRRHAVPLDRVAQAVLQFAKGPASVDRNVAILVEPRDDAVARGLLRQNHAGRRQQAEEQQEKGQAGNDRNVCWFHAADISRPILTGQ